jgi:hypothetical protein
MGGCFAGIGKMFAYIILSIVVAMTVIAVIGMIIQ